MTTESSSDDSLGSPSLPAKLDIAGLSAAAYAISDDWVQMQRIFNGLRNRGIDPNSESLPGTCNELALRFGLTQLAKKAFDADDWTAVNIAAQQWADRLLSGQPKRKSLSLVLPPEIPTESFLTAEQKTRERSDPDGISKAIGIFSSDPTLTDSEVARRAGIKHQSNLTRSESYQAVKKIFQDTPPPRGFKDGDSGKIEAFE